MIIGLLSALLVAGGSFLQGADVPSGAPQLPLITNVVQFYSESAQRIALGCRVRLQTLVTYCDPDWGMLFVQDDTGATFVALDGLRPSLDLGDQVLIQGTSSFTNQARRILNLEIKNLGPGRQPSSAPANAAGLMDPSAGDRYVQVRGVVRSFCEEEHLRLMLEIEGQHVPVWVRKHLPTDLMGLLDARVRLKGVCSREYDQAGKVKGVALFTTSFREIGIESAEPPDPFMLPATPIRRLLGTSGNSPSRRVRIHGQVTYQRPGDSLGIADSTGALRALYPFSRLWQADQRVDVLGFLVVRQGEALLEDAMVREVPTSGALASTAAEVAATNQVLPELDRIEPVVRLRPDQARQRYPVRLRGVVTYYDPLLRNLFIHGQTAGLYVEPGDFRGALVCGQEVEVTGVTDPGAVVPMIVRSHIQALGPGELPAPARIGYHQGLSATYDCRWVEVQGVVQSVEVREGQVTLDLAAEDGRFQGRLPDRKSEAVLTNLVDAVVRVQGVCAMIVNEARLFTGVRILIPGADRIQVLEAPPKNSEEVPERSIAEILRFLPPEIANRHLRVRGVVTLQRPNQGFFIQDSTGGLYVENLRSTGLRLGDEVEAIGFRTVGGQTPVLRQSAVRLLGRQIAIAPVRLTAEQLLDGEHHAELVQVEGRLVDDVAAALAPEYVLQAGSVIFNASLETPESLRPVPELRAGSVLRLTGVCLLRAADYGHAKSFSLLLRSPQDLQTVRSPPWFTRRRVVSLVVFMLVAVLAALGWVTALRRRVRRQTELIRQRLERETALEARYQQLVENANDIILTHNPQGRILDLNRAGERLLGYERAEILTKDLSEIVAAEHRSRLAALLEVQPSNLAPAAYELEVLTKAGRRLTLELSTRFIQEAGQTTRCESIARDITDRKEAEAQLRRSEAQLLKLSRAVAQSPAAILITDTQGRIEYVNPKFSEISGFSPAEVLGQNPRLFKSGRMPPETYTRMWQTITSGREWHGELENCKKHGEHYYVSSLISPLKNDKEEVTHFIAVQEDITRRRELETQLRQAQKMESIGQLAAGVAHDFNNLLTVIQGHTSLLQGDPHLPPETAESLTQIAASSRRAADLTRQLLAFSRKQLIQAQPLDLNQAVRHVLKLLERVLGEHIALEADCASGLPTIKADPSMVEQVIMNLAVNARDAMPQGGRLTIHTAQAQVDATQARTHPDAQVGSFVQLTVEDTGTGMDQATLSRLFEPFFTTKEVGRGTGLGLATIYGIVHQHGGWIQVVSRVGVGSTFEVYWPVYGAPAETLMASPAPVPKRTEVRTVLVVEDEPALRILAARVLGRQGFQTLQAESGKAALELCARHAGPIDLLLTDMVMPDGVSGRELAQRLGVSRPDLKVIFSSGYSPDLAGAGLTLREGSNFLQKPYTPTVLVQTVTAALDHQKP